MMHYDRVYQKAKNIHENAHLRSSNRGSPIRLSIYVLLSLLDRYRVQRTGMHEFYIIYYQHHSSLSILAVHASDLLYSYICI